MSLILALALVGQPSAAGLSPDEIAALAASYHHTAWMAAGKPTTEQIAARFNAENAGPSSTTEVKVRPTDLDSKGHVNNSRHVEYLQAARWEWLEARGITDESLKAAGAVLVVVDVHIAYRAEVQYPATVKVVTTAKADGEKKVVFRQSIHRPDGMLASEATVIMVAIDPSAMPPRSRPIPDALRKALESAEARKVGTPIPMTWADLELRAYAGWLGQRYKLEPLLRCR